MRIIPPCLELAFIRSLLRALHDEGGGVFCYHFNYSAYGWASAVADGNIRDRYIEKERGGGGGDNSNSKTLILKDSTVAQTERDK